MTNFFSVIGRVLTTFSWQLWISDRTACRYNDFLEYGIFPCFLSDLFRVDRQLLNLPNSKMVESISFSFFLPFLRQVLDGVDCQRQQSSRTIICVSIFYCWFEDHVKIKMCQIICVVSHSADAQYRYRFFWMKNLSLKGL